MARNIIIGDRFDAASGSTVRFSIKLRSWTPASPCKTIDARMIDTSGTVFGPSQQVSLGTVNVTSPDQVVTFEWKAPQMGGFPGCGYCNVTFEAYFREHPATGNTIRFVREGRLVP